MNASDFLDQRRFERQIDLVLPDDIIDGVNRPIVAVYSERSTGDVYQVFSNTWFRRATRPVLDGGRLSWDEWVRLE
jgi:hypothetical protein